MKANTKLNQFIKKYTMILALVVVFILFTILTDNRLILSQNISNLLLQNAYVLVTACGMLLCILTGGNVDLSIGSTLCLSAAIAAKMMSIGKDPLLAILAGLAHRICPYPTIYLYTGRNVFDSRYSSSYPGF